MFTPFDPYIRIGGSNSIGFQTFLNHRPLRHGQGAGTFGDTERRLHLNNQTHKSNSHVYKR